VTRRLAFALVLLASCRGVSPLTNRIAVGHDPFVVLVGEAPDGWTDLFAVAAEGGEAVRFTFTRNLESVPALDPTGGVVAFVRRPVTDPDSRATLVIMNLINSAEREVPLPADLGTPQRVGWDRDGRTLYIRGDARVMATPAPPAPTALEQIGPDHRRWPEADTALTVLLGTPAFARVQPCTGETREFCVVSPDGAESRLGASLRHPFRWGADSLGYLERGRLLVRPLAGGRSRVVDWVNAPANPRQLSYWSP
jgi:hypothetical protein